MGWLVLGWLFECFVADHTTQHVSLFEHRAVLSVLVDLQVSSVGARVSTWWLETRSDDKNLSAYRLPRGHPDKEMGASIFFSGFRSVSDLVNDG